MNKLQIFSSEEFGEIRTAVVNNEPMFCLSDICKSLGLSQPSKVKERLNEKGVRTIPTLTSGGEQNLLYINEPNLYKAIFQSRKESAEHFTEWVTSEVLPSIRKNGGYIAGQETLSDEELLSKAKKGKTFKKFVQQIIDLGYEVQFKELIAADYGAPTMRKRFFMIARCDGKPIVWPEPTHAPADSEAVKNGLLKPYVGAYTQLDFSLPCPSIFDTSEEIKEKYGIRAKRPLAPKTMERIARGLKKFVIDNAEPFIVQVNHSGAKSDYCKSADEPLNTITGKHGFGVVEPYMVPVGYGEREGQAPRVHDVEKPLPTIVGTGKHYLCETYLSPTLIQYHSETSKNGVRGQTIEEPIMTVDGSNRYGLVTSFLHKYYDGGYRGAGESMEKPLPTVTSWDHNSVVTANLIQMNNHCDGRDITEPIPTITAGDGHFGEVRAFLIKYYGQGTGQDIKAPLDTVTAQDRFGLVTIEGVDYQIVDIGLRMLEPKELYGCQGFPEDYIIDHDYTGKTYPRSEQVRRCGNAVCPPIPAALVRANLPELCVAERTPNMKIETEQTGQLRFA